MIDFISVELLESSLTESLLNNPLLNFTIPLNEETGEINPNNKYYSKKIASYNSLTFVLIENIRDKSKKIHLKGSIHKFHNKGHNHTDFNLNHLKTALNSLKTQFNISLDKSIVHSLEFGVNILTPIECSSLLNDLVYYTNTKPKEDNFLNNGQLIRFDKNQYRLKLYNKSLQYFKLGILDYYDNQLLRFEIHVDKMQYLQSKQIKIYSLEDLLNIDYLNKLGQLLYETFSKIILYDSRLKTDVLKTKDKQFIQDLSNPKKWDKISQDKRPKYYQRQLKKFRSLINSNTPDNLQLITANKISDKWIELSKNVPFLPFIEKPEMSLIYPYVVCNKEALIRRYCIVTGLDITEQKNESKFLAETTIDKILMADKTMYYELLKNYAPKKQTENVNYHIAHNIRNAYFNDSNNLRRKLKKSINQTTLFDPKEVLTLSKRQKELLSRFSEITIKL
jgi:hypothetical protein